MRRSTAAVGSVAWFVTVGGTFGCLLPPPQLVVRGFHRYVRNPIYVGFLVILAGQVLLSGSAGMLEYSAVALCTAAAAVHWYEEPVLARKFGAEYQDYRHAVPAWLPRLHPWTPGGQAGRAGSD